MITVQANRYSTMPCSARQELSSIYSTLLDSEGVFTLKNHLTCESSRRDNTLSVRSAGINEASQYNFRLVMQASSLCKSCYETH